MLLSDDITNESRVMFHRQLRSASRGSRRSCTTTRIRISSSRTAGCSGCRTPTRRRGRYPVLHAGGRTASNYIRNSVKATVDAYHGTIAFYLIDDDRSDRADARSASSRTLFRPLAEMPEDLRTRLRYPEGIFALQAAMYATYHMTNPAVFYNKEDQWEVPAIDARAAVRS